METFLVVKEVSLMTYFMWIDTKAGSDAMLNACVAVINPPRLHLLTFISNLYFYNLMVSKWLVQLLMIIFILLIGHYFVSLFVKISPVFWINPSSLLLCMCGGIKIELLRFSWTSLVTQSTTRNTWTLRETMRSPREEWWGLTHWVYAGFNPWKENGKIT